MTRVTFLRDTETITASRVCHYSVNHSNVHLIIVFIAQSDTKFPKVVQADTLGEVGILGTVLLRVYSWTILPIFIEIGSHLMTREQK